MLTPVNGSACRAAIVSDRFARLTDRPPVWHARAPVSFPWRDRLPIRSQRPESARLVGQSGNRPLVAGLVPAVRHHSVNGRNGPNETLTFSAMFTDTYAQALYGAIYATVGPACQDRIRYAYGSWLARELPTDRFLGVLQDARSLR